MSCFIRLVALCTGPARGGEYVSVLDVLYRIVRLWPMTFEMEGLLVRCHVSRFDVDPQAVHLCHPYHTVAELLFASNANRDWKCEGCLSIFFHSQPGCVIVEHADTPYTFARWTMNQCYVEW